jgi:hypothetical protein
MQCHRMPTLPHEELVEDDGEIPSAELYHLRDSDDSNQNYRRILYCPLHELESHHWECYHVDNDLDLIVSNKLRSKPRKRVDLDVPEQKMMMVWLAIGVLLTNN